MISVNRTVFVFSTKNPPSKDESLAFYKGCTGVITRVNRGARVPGVPCTTSGHPYTSTINYYIACLACPTAD